MKSLSQASQQKNVQPMIAIIYAHRQNKKKKQLIKSINKLNNK